MRNERSRLLLALTVFGAACGVARLWPSTPANIAVMLAGSLLLWFVYQASFRSD